MLSLVVLLPIGALLLKGANYGLAGIWDTVNRERVWAALFLSFRLSFLAAVFNLVFGVILAWVLTRYDDVRQVCMGQGVSSDRLRPFYDSLKDERRTMLAEVMRSREGTHLFLGQGRGWRSRQHRTT